MKLELTSLQRIIFDPYAPTEVGNVIFVSGIFVVTYCVEHPPPPGQDIFAALDPVFTRSLASFTRPPMRVPVV